MNDVVDAQPVKRVSRPFWWVIAFLFFPYGSFIYLAWLGLLRWNELSVALLASVLVHVGLVSVLAQTNDQPWQPWLVLLLGTGMYGLGSLQFAIGNRSQVWSPGGCRAWYVCAWFFGVILLIGLALQIAQFHVLAGVGVGA